MADQRTAPGEERAAAAIRHPLGSGWPDRADKPHLEPQFRAVPAIIGVCRESGPLPGPCLRRTGGSPAGGPRVQALLVG